jgi:transketolase N-terminal domain/subunit
MLYRIAQRQDMKIDRKTIYKRILDLVMETKHGHIPSSFSVVEILCKLYDEKKPDDKIILSKGHGCYAQYAILMELGIMPRDYPIKGHPDLGMPGIQASTGSLGHGLPIAVGMALAKRIKHDRGMVYCILGDGETEEGSVWEAWNIAWNLELKNLSVIVDNNERRFNQMGVWGLPYLLFNKKGYPSKMMMADPAAWHHKVPSEIEYKQLCEEIDAL